MNARFRASVLGLVLLTSLAVAAEKVTEPKAGDPAKILIVVELSGRVPAAARTALTRILARRIPAGAGEAFGSDYEPVLGPDRLVPVFGSGEKEMKTEASAKNAGAILLLRIVNRDINRARKAIKTIVKVSLYSLKKGSWRKLHAAIIRAEGYGLASGAASDLVDLRLKIETMLAEKLIPRLIPHKVNETETADDKSTAIYVEVTNTSAKPIRGTCLKVPYGKGNFVKVWSKDPVPAGETRELVFKVEAAYRKVKGAKARLIVATYGRGGKGDTERPRRRHRRGWRR